MKRLRPASPYATEHQEQMTLLAWAGTVLLRDRPLSQWLLMIPNESLLSMIAPGGRRYAYWAKLLKMGFRKGASDLLLAYPVFGEPAGMAGLWIEMKRRREAFSGPSAFKAAVSDAQTDFHLQMRSAGYGTAVAYGWEEARDVINAYLGSAIPRGGPS